MYTIGDYFILISAILIMLALVSNNDGHKQWLYDHKGIAARDIYIFVSFMSLFMAILILWKAETGILKLSFFFSIIAGTITQTLLADPILTKMTLTYDRFSSKIIKTPWWVAMLWGIVLTHFCYFWLRLNTTTMPFSAKYIMFILSGSFYFYAFEFTNANYAYWWTRKNCRQPFGVAIYATIAETLTVAILPFFLNAVHSFAEAVYCGTVAGVVIAAFFIVSSSITYKKHS
jgi:hypothetical protein